MRTTDTSRFTLSRRHFLRCAGNTTLLLGLGGASPLIARSGEESSAPRLTPDLLGHIDEIEPLARRLIDVRPEGAAEMLAAELRSGTPLNVGFAALFTAAARGNFHHAVFVVHPSPPPTPCGRRSKGSPVFSTLV